VSVVSSAVHWKQRTHKYHSTHKYMICCHIAHNNGIFIILTLDFSKEQYVLPDDDNVRCYRNMYEQFKCFSVNNFRLIYDTQLANLLVCNIQ